MTPQTELSCIRQHLALLSSRRRDACVRVHAGRYHDYSAAHRNWSYCVYTYVALSLQSGLVLMYGHCTAVMVVGALIFVLGIDLVKEALWDTRHRVSRMEYITIASIMIVMTVWDFVTGVLFGIVVSCTSPQLLVLARFGLTARLATS